MSNPKISIVIPAYNEAESIGDVVGKIRSLHPDAEVIVIDDGSQDKTAERAVQAGAIVYSSPLQHRQRCRRQEWDSSGQRRHPRLHGRGRAA